MPDIFTADELEAEAATETTPEANLGPAVEPTETPQRDEQGRFAPKADDAEPAEDAEKHQQGTVPQGALHAEREKRKGAEAELKAAREQLAAIQTMREQIAARKPEPLPAADDPSAMEHLRQRVAANEEQQNRISQHIDTQAADQAEMQQLGAVMGSSEAEFRKSTPDYDDSINYLVNARAEELAMYGMPVAQIRETVAAEATEIVRTAIQQGRNPAELGYQIARTRGYRPAQAQGGAAATLDAITRAQAGSKSLSQGAGTTPQLVNAQAVANMSGDEFDALYSTPEGRRMIDAL